VNDKNLQVNSLSFAEIKSAISSKMAYTALEGNILTAAQGQEKKTFLITSSISGEGKTFSTLMMAQALAAHSNATVLLIEGNFNKPQLNKAFNLVPNSELGVAEYFSSTSEAKEFIIKTGDDNIFLMPFIDNKKTNVERCFYHALFATQLEKLKHTGFDYILLDGTAVMGGSEALAIAKFFDSVILVVECEKTKWEVVQLASEKLTQVKAKQLGVVLNKRSYPIPSRFYS
jgi:Mrp family chromosome partitioning ATPase